jgi:hypothetical protein
MIIERSTADTPMELAKLIHLVIPYYIDNIRKIFVYERWVY